jgi:hypothetical protein
MELCIKYFYFTLISLVDINMKFSRVGNRCSDLGNSIPTSPQDSGGPSERARERSLLVAETNPISVRAY